MKLSKTPSWVYGLLGIFGTLMIIFTLPAISVHAQQMSLLIPDIPTNKSSDKLDQIIQLQKQNNKELALIICTDYRAQRLYGQPDTIGNYQWQQSDYDCISKVLTDTH